VAAEDVVWVLDRIASAEQLRTGADRTLQARLLLVVDRLERMFGTDDAAKVSALLRALVATGRVWLIATLRSDRYAALQTDRDLLKLRRYGTVYDLPPPGQAEISDIVKGPARAAIPAAQAVTDLRMRETVPASADGTWLRRPTFVTQAEYQLFLLSKSLEQRSDFVPLHWKRDYFRGEPADPITGITARQSSAFAAWATKTGEHEWQLPQMEVTDLPDGCW
jgi:conflict system STAND superfamily ATPase